MAATDGVAVLLVLFSEWMQRRQMLRLLGAEVENLDPIDILNEAAAQVAAEATGTPAADPTARYAEVAAFAAMSGGEVIDA